MLNECSIYDTVDVASMVFNLQEKTSVNKDSKNFRIVKAIFKNLTGMIACFVW